MHCEGFSMPSHPISNKLFKLKNFLSILKYVLISNYSMLLTNDWVNKVFITKLIQCATQWAS